MPCVGTVNQTIIATELEWRPAGLSALPATDFTANHNHSLSPAVYSPPALGDYTAVQKQSSTVRVKSSPTASDIHTRFTKVRFLAELLYCIELGWTRVHVFVSTELFCTLHLICWIIVLRDLVLPAQNIFLVFKLKSCYCRRLNPSLFSYN